VGETKVNIISIQGPILLRKRRANRKQKLSRAGRAWKWVLPPGMREEPHVSQRSGEGCVLLSGPVYDESRFGPAPGKEERSWIQSLCVPLFGSKRAPGPSVRCKSNLSS